MIDLHCHILSGIDDGAENFDESLRMARMAADSGVKVIVATPHCALLHDHQSLEDFSVFSEHTIALHQAVQAAEIPLVILPGAEVLCTSSLPQLLQLRHQITLAGSHYLLVEFYFDELLSVMDDALHFITEHGFTPVIAHPERYEAVQHTPHVTERWFHQGYIIQLNKGSIQGTLGSRAHRTADWLLRHGLAHVVASDAHGTERRTPNLRRVRNFLEEIIPPAYAKLLLSDNPSRIIQDRPVVRSR